MSNSVAEKTKSILAPVDIYETKDEYILQLDMPGVRKEDISIVFKDSVLELKGDVPAGEPAAAAPFLCARPGRSNHGPDRRQCGDTLRHFGHRRCPGPDHDRRRGGSDGPIAAQREEIAEQRQEIDALHVQVARVQVLEAQLASLRATQDDVVALRAAIAELIRERNAGIARTRLDP